MQTIRLGRIMLIVTHSLKLHPVCKLAGRSYSGSSHTSSYKHWLQLPTGFVYALGDSSLFTPWMLGLKCRYQTGSMALHL